jgi:hypothetical protein
MITKYKATLKPEIKKVQVKKETEMFVVWDCPFWKRERSEAKVSDYYAYLDTFADAKNWIVNKNKNEIKILEGKISYRQKRLAEAEAIKEE